MIAAQAITLGILAGGRGTRLGGCDKAWLERDGVPQVVRIAARFAPEVSGILVSANRDHARYVARGLAVVGDRTADAGPLAGLESIARACATPWLLTVPVDLVGVNECLLPTLAAAGGDGAFGQDDDGPQPLVALWRTENLRRFATEALAAGDFAIHALQSRLRMVPVRFAGVRFGNLNTADDLRAAGIALP